MAMTIQEIAAFMNGVEYDQEDDRIKELGKGVLQANGVVIAFGASDDLLELRGAIDDEFELYGGTEGFLYKNKFTTQDAVDGLRDAIEEALSDCGINDRDIIDGIVAPILASPTLTATWCPEGKNCSWEITTSLPYAPFNVMEDGEVFCIGAVFELPAPGAQGGAG